MNSHAEDVLSACELCPRRCRVNRYAETGFCGAGSLAKVALVSLHPWEEPCLVGEKGAGTVFFSNCSLRCIFCQNHEISHAGRGVEVTDSRLAEIFLEQQARGAATLDLVTPTHYVPQIVKSLDMAKKRGFSLPVVYNSSAYETAETIRRLAGYVDIYLPDLKYLSGESAGSCSGAPDYPRAARAAIREMAAQAGAPVWGNAGQLQRGVLVRHLVLPGHRHESMRIIDWLWREFGNDVLLSLMNQYTPMYKAKEVKGLNRRLTSFEYESVVEHAAELGIRHCYVQERRAAGEEYVPVFDGRGVKANIC